MNRLKTVFLLILVLISCTNEDEFVNSQLYTGEDITSYASFSADAGTKKASVEVVNNGSWKLFCSDKSGEVNFEVPVLQGSLPGKSELDNKFRIYCLEWVNGTRAAFALRQLPMEGQVNFRDLGGYKTTDGKRVKWGMVFRSGKCNELTDSDISYLAGIPLKTVVDFRSNEERASEPDKVPATVSNQIHYPINPGNLSSVDLTKAIAEGDIEAARRYLVDANEQLVISFQEEYKAFFATLADNKNIPLMFHCTAGKDRAGLAAALFLASLGVDRKTIVEDYLLTNTLTGISLEKMKEIYGDNNTAICMYYISSVQKEYIEKAFTTIEGNYGNVNNFLINQLGVDIQKMKDLYLY